MRVPQSPKSLRRVMTVSSVRGDEDEGASSSSEDGANNNNDNCKKSKTNSSEAARPPRPTYTSRYKDGKYTVGVETTMFTAKVDTKTNPEDNHASTESTDTSIKIDIMSHGFTRGRDRTRISAVQRLVERKLAQKEKERLKEREMERDRLGHNLNTKFRSNSSSGAFIRDRSWGPTSESPSNEKSQFERKPRTENENEYLASLLWRTSRSCSGTRRRGGLSDCEDEVSKTIITIGPGKPTRIREHSPSKKSPTSELPPSGFDSEIDDKVET